MATELAKAYVQIIPSAEGIKGKITEALGGEASSAGKDAGKSFGSSMVGMLKKALVAAGIGTAIKESIEEGAALQQSLGGIETLFKDSADTMKQYAAEAYRTAGMSANEYMETATGFAASLLQGLGGNTEKAAEMANTAITDMSDNANKMGTSMESIQNAYQGFAKQNYTMLDNLKLGYGGTKSEMERLLADAQKITGVKYDLDNLSDVYEAIHVIQGELDITGTTAKEAASTLSGSMASMKSAFTNVLGNLALGEDIGPSLDGLFDAVFTFLTGNLVPMVANVIRGMPQALSGTISAAVQLLNIAENNAGAIVQMGLDVVAELVTGLVSAAPYLLEAAIRLTAALGSALLETDWAGAAEGVIATLRDSLALAGAEILGTDGSIVTCILQSVTDRLPGILEKGIEIVSSLSTGILSNLPEAIESIGQVLNQLLAFVLENLPVVLQAGVTLIGSLSQGFLDNIPTAVASISLVLGQILTTIGENMPAILESGITLISSLARGFLDNIPTAVASIGQVLNQLLAFVLENLPVVLQAGVKLVGNLAQGFLDNIPTIIASIGKVLAQLLATIGKHLPKILQAGITLIGELAAGLIRAIPNLISKIPQIISSVKENFLRFDWGSIGANIISGIGNGIKAGVGAIMDAAKSAAKAALDAAKSFLGINSPSKVMKKEVGRWIPAGVAEGIEGNTSAVAKAVKEMEKEATGSIQADLAVELSKGQRRLNLSQQREREKPGGGYQQHITINSPEALSPSEVARQTRNATRNMVLALQGV